MCNLTKVDGVANADIEKIDGVAAADIEKVSGVTKAAAGPTPASRWRVGGTAPAAGQFGTKIFLPWAGSVGHPLSNSRRAS